LPSSCDDRMALIGTSGQASLTVAAEDTAIAAGSGDIPVLATPRLIALMEAAACEALRGNLDPDQTSVGAKVMVDHLRPTLVGTVVNARADIIDIDGDRVQFAVSAEQPGKNGPVTIGEGTHLRVIVRREPFLQRAR
jgi:fluoroacetyl-CoA thioesterase